MDASRKAMQQALEALETLNAQLRPLPDSNACTAIAVLRAALAQQEQELYTLAEYTGDGFRRQWVTVGAWLTPGERIVHLGPAPRD